MREDPALGFEGAVPRKESTFSREFFDQAGWRVVLASAVGVGFGLSALPFYTLGVFTKPLAAAFGWSRAQVQGALAFMMFGTLFTAWFAGWLADRFGVRRVALASQAGLAVGLCALALMSGGLGIWYAAWLLMAVLGIGTTPITWTRGIATWFDAGRGLALGIALMGTGVTAFLAPPITTWLIEAFGWRTAYLAWAAAVLLVAMPVVSKLFYERKEIRRAASNTADAPPTAGALAGLSIREAARAYRFWLLMAGFAAISFGVGGLIPNLVPLLTDKGLSSGDAAFYASIIGVNVICGRLIAGYLLDRFWAPAVAYVFLSLPALSCVVLAQDLPNAPMTGVAAALVGLAAGAEFDLIAYMCTRYFGMRNYGQIYAWQWAAFMLAAGLAPPVFGRVYDMTASYNPALYTAAAAFVIGPTLLLGLGRYPTFAPRESD